MAGAGERPSGPKLSEAARAAGAARERRLAQAMRENLIKRKRQQRAGAAGEAAPGAWTGEGGGDEGEREPG